MQIFTNYTSAYKLAIASLFLFLLSRGYKLINNTVDRCFRFKNCGIGMAGYEDLKYKIISYLFFLNDKLKYIFKNNKTNSSRISSDPGIAIRIAL